MSEQVPFYRLYLLRLAVYHDQCWGGLSRRYARYLTGSPMMALCAVWNWESRPRKVPEGGLQGAILEGYMEKNLRTFSGPVLNDDVIEPPFLGYIAFLDASHKSTSQKLHKT